MAVMGRFLSRYGENVADAHYGERALSRLGQSGECILSEQPASKRNGHLLPVLALVAGVIVLVLLTQRAIASAVAGFVAGIWVSAMELVFGLFGGLFGG
jgi:hypothetical protein